MSKSQEGQTVGFGPNRRVKGTPEQEAARGARNASMQVLHRQAMKGQTMAMPTHQVVLRNLATGGRVSRVSGVEHHDQWTARAEADRRNAREGREHKNVCWTVREVAR